MNYLLWNMRPWEDDDRDVEKMHLILVGQPSVLESHIRELSSLGYVKVGVWTPLQETDEPSEIMTVMVKPRVS